MPKARAHFTCNLLQLGAHIAYIWKNTGNAFLMWELIFYHQKKNKKTQRRYLGRKRIITSPSPVAAAPPAVLSAYAPAPMMGESPTRLQTSICGLLAIVLPHTLQTNLIKLTRASCAYPGTLCVSPLVDVPAATWPFWSIAITPGGGKNKEKEEEITLVWLGITFRSLVSKSINNKARGTDRV